MISSACLIDFITHSTETHIDLRLFNMLLCVMLVLSRNCLVVGQQTCATSSPLCSLSRRRLGSSARTPESRRSIQLPSSPSRLRRRGAVMKHVLSAGRRRRPRSDISGMFERFIGSSLLPLLIQTGFELQRNSRSLLSTCVSEAGK